MVGRWLFEVSTIKCTWVSTLTSCRLFQRNGADFSVFVNTSSDFDGSDSGARPDEAVSWGKIKMDATPVKVILCPFLESRKKPLT